MFSKILIANRGEIALRVIRACREMGILSVVVYSKADADSLPPQLADEAVCVGGPQAKDSYLNPYNVLAAAQVTGAQAIHPGYGFLAENAKFARMCAQCGVKFIGPTPESMELMGDKLAARRTMKAAGVPVIPGSDGALTGIEEARALAEEIGYPVMLKAVAGGGGRGIRRADNAQMLEDAYNVASGEAAAAFGDGSLYLERCIAPARHIEFQLLMDEHGGGVHLFERECSLQRRNQKLIEESPSPSLDAETREAMGAIAVKAAYAAGYHNAGTIEFLVDGDGHYYFMEMNTRIQVEHPVTEMVTGIDLVQQQIRVAAGERLSFEQEDVRQTGHAIECRVNAEDPANNFRPTGGTVAMLAAPGGPGVRFDSFLYQGYRVPPFYDQMLAKVIVHAPTRPQAIAKMRGALTEVIIDGFETNIEYQLSLLALKDFERGAYDTGTISRISKVE